MNAPFASSSSTTKIHFRQSFTFYFSIKMGKSHTQKKLNAYKRGARPVIYQNERRNDRKPFKMKKKKKLKMRRKEQFSSKIK